MGNIIIIASGKGGTGKTTLTSHLGAALASMGKLTAVVDADAGFRNLDIALGLESNIVYDYSDFINGSCVFDDILIKSPDLSDLYFIPAPQSVPTTDFSEEKTAEFWNTLKNRFEFILADAPAGMGDGFMFAAEYADEAIIVSLPETSSLRDADRVITELENLNISTIRLVLNRIQPELIERKIAMNIDDCMDVLSIPILGIIPEDKVIQESVSQAKPLLDITDYGAGRAINNIAGRLLGNEIHMMKFISKKDGFFRKLANIFK